MLTWAVDYLICAELAVLEGSLSDLFWTHEDYSCCLSPWLSVLSWLTHFLARCSSEATSLFVCHQSFYYSWEHLVLERAAISLHSALNKVRSPGESFRTSLLWWSPSPPRKNLWATTLELGAMTGAYSLGVTSLLWELVRSSGLHSWLASLGVEPLPHKWAKGRVIGVPVSWPALSGIEFKSSGG